LLEPDKNKPWHEIRRRQDQEEPRELVMAGTVLKGYKVVVKSAMASPLATLELGWALARWRIATSLRKVME
jgi:hypothetical protein